MSKKITKTEFATFAIAKGQATAKTKKRGEAYIAYQDGDVFKVMLKSAHDAAQDAAQAAHEASPEYQYELAQMQAAQGKADVPAGDVVIKSSGVKRSGGAVTQAVKFLHGQGVHTVSDVIVETVQTRKGEDKHWLVSGGKRLSWFDTKARVDAVLAAL